MLKDGDAIVICARKVPGIEYDPRALEPPCELCKTIVIATPATVEYAERPTVHVVCNECAAILLLEGHEMKMGGVIDVDKPLPWEK